MATNLDHFVTSNQPKPVDETPQTTGFYCTTNTDSVSPSFEATEPTGAMNAGETSFVSTPSTRSSAKSKRDRDMPKTVLRRPLPLTDDEAALHSLDDTVMRPMPARPGVWSDELRRPRQEERRRSFRISTAALVCIVAVVSFVAGGVVARLSSQMPVLFAQKAETANSQASFTQEQPEAVAETQDEPVQEPETAPQDEHIDNPPAYDMGYDTVSDTPDQTTTNTTDDNSWRWDLDEEGNESISYDPDTNQMTIDYEGYSFSMPIGNLIGDNGNGYTTYSLNGTDGNSSPDRTYGDGMGYDTEDAPDQYVWGTPRSFGWS